MPRLRKDVASDVELSAAARQKEQRIASVANHGWTPSEPSARALTVQTPRNLSDANAVLHMLHTLSRISGLGALCGALTQAIRSNSATNIPRDSAWSLCGMGGEGPLTNMMRPSS